MPEAANRYNGLPVGPRLEYSFEIQSGIPIDGSNALARDLSPFTLRLILPDSLLEIASGNSNAENSVNLISAAATGAVETPTLATTLGRGLVVASSTTVLEQYVANGVLTSKAQPALVQAAQVADIALQAERLLNTPPLTLLINPNNMNISYTNIQNYSSRNRYGYVFERWGEDQPSISFSGMTGAFIAGVGASQGTDPRVSQAQGMTSSVSGVQFASKRDSAAWQNLMSLFHFYCNNGYIYDTVGKTEAHQFIGAVAIDYDQWTYIGHIESFEYSYDESKPHNIEWNMEFRVSRMYDNSVKTYSVQPQQSPTVSPSDPRYANRQRSSATWGSLDELKANAVEYGTIPFEQL